jgi:hypothetical protein
VVDVEELASSERKSHALIVFLQLVVDLCRDKGCQLALRECFILKQSLTKAQTTVSFMPYPAYWQNSERNLHLADRSSDFGPQEVDLLVQPVQGEGAQRWVRFREETDDAGS